MKIRQITEIIENFAPLGYQESYDNSGLLVGSPDDEVAGALICVDVTEEVLVEAVELGAGIIISHHPVIFNPLRRLTGANYIERVVAQAIRRGIAIYACHTNLDSAPAGLSFCLAEMFGVQNPQLLSPSKEGNYGLGVIGYLPAPADTVGFLRHVAAVLSIKSLRYSAPAFEKVTRVAICSGAGASLIEEAQAAGAELYLSADFKYNHFLDAAGAMTVADMGHFESEYCAIELLHSIISKKLPTFALHKSRKSANPVNYLITI